MFLKAITYGGIDIHDMSTSIEQISFKGNTDISKEDIKKAIAEHIIKTYPFLQKSMVRYCVKQCSKFKSPCMKEEKTKNGKTRYVFPESSIIENNGKTHIHYESEIEWNPERQTMIYNTWWGQAQFKTRYVCYDIPKNDVCYLAQENFLNVGKGVDIVQRTYWKPFKNYLEAKAALESLPPRIINDCSVERIVTVERYSVINQNKCIRNNMRANELMKEKGRTPYDEDFRIYVSSHIEHLESL